VCEELCLCCVIWLKVVAQIIAYVRIIHKLLNRGIYIHIQRAHYDCVKHIASFCTCSGHDEFLERTYPWHSPGHLSAYILVSAYVGLGCIRKSCLFFSSQLLTNSLKGPNNGSWKLESSSSSFTTLWQHLIDDYDVHRATVGTRS
jgi:hypothetical protein